MFLRGKCTICRTTSQTGSSLGIGCPSFCHTSYTTNTDRRIVPPQKFVTWFLLKAKASQVMMSLFLEPQNPHKCFQTLWYERGSFSALLSIILHFQSSNRDTQNQYVSFKEPKKDNSILRAAMETSRQKRILCCVRAIRMGFLDKSKRSQQECYLA